MTVIPEIVRYFRKGRYLLGTVRGEEEAVVLARLIGPKRKATIIPLTAKKEEKEKTQEKKKKKKTSSRLQ